MKNYYLKDSITLKKIVDDKKFSFHNGTIWYYVDKGMYLAFDERDLSYIGVEMCFLANAKEYEPKVNKTLLELLKLELIEER